MKNGKKKEKGSVNWKKRWIIVGVGMVILALGSGYAGYAVQQIGRAHV